MEYQTRAQNQFAREDYSGLKILGWLQIVNGVLSVGLSVATIVTLGYVNFAAVAFPAGLVYCVHGVIALMFEKRQTRRLRIAQFVLGIVSCIFASVYYAAASSSAVSVAHGVRGGNIVNYHHHVSSSGTVNVTPLQAPGTKMEKYYQENKVTPLFTIYGIEMVSALLAFSCSLWSVLYKTPCCKVIVHRQHPIYSSLSAGISAVGQFVIGVLTVGLGVTMALFEQFFVEYVMLIAGLFYMISGIFGYVSSIQKTKAWIITTMVLSIVTAFFLIMHVAIAGAQFSQHIMRCSHGGMYWTWLSAEMYCSKAHTALRVLQFLLALTQLAFLIWSSALACRSCCCPPDGGPAISHTSVLYHQPNQQAQIYMMQNGQLVPMQVMPLPGNQHGLVISDPGSVPPALAQGDSGSPPPAYVEKPAVE